MIECILQGAATDTSTHERLGRRWFRVSFPLTYAYRYLAIQAVCVPMMLLRYTETTFMLSSSSVIFLVICVGLAPYIIRLVLRSLTEVHVYDRGLVMARSGRETELLFDTVTAFELFLDYRHNQLQLRIKLVSPETSVHFMDDCEQLDTLAEERVFSLARHLVNHTPRSVKVTGRHAIERIG